MQAFEAAIHILQTATGSGGNDFTARRSVSLEYYYDAVLYVTIFDTRHPSTQCHMQLNLLRQKMPATSHTMPLARHRKSHFLGDAIGRKAHSDISKHEVSASKVVLRVAMD